MASTIVFTISVLFLELFLLIRAGPIVYKKPSRLWFYKSHPPYYGYPSFKHHPYGKLKDVHVYYSDPFEGNALKHHAKNIRPFDKLKAGTVLGGHGLLVNGKKYGWPTDLGHQKFVDPVFGRPYYNHHQQHQLQLHHQHSDADIKPVKEHIEDDLKYDFRTNTHSYDRS